MLCQHLRWVRFDLCVCVCKGRGGVSHNINIFLHVLLLLSLLEAWVCASFKDYVLPKKQNTEMSHAMGICAVFEGACGDGAGTDQGQR